MNKIFTGHSPEETGDAWTGGEEVLGLGGHQGNGTAEEGVAVAGRCWAPQLRDEGAEPRGLLGFFSNGIRGV